MKQFYVCLVFVFSLFTVAQADIDWTYWGNWVTTNVRFSTTNKAIVITGALAHELGAGWLLWYRCWNHVGGRREPIDDCVRAVMRQVLIWTVELTSLGAVTGWWKRDDAIALGSGAPLILIDDFVVLEGKRDLETKVTFEYDGSHYVHTSNVYERTSDYQLALVGAVETNVTMPLMALEIADGALVLSPFDLDLIVKRDDLESNYYVSGSGSLVLECQYGGVIKAPHMWDIGSLFSDMVISKISHSEHAAFHVAGSKSSGVECTTKVYNSVEDWSHW